MKQQTTQSTWQPVESAELTQIDGGIWDYSNRLGMLGQTLEANQDGKYGVSFTPSTLDGAARQRLQGWVSIP